MELSLSVFTVRLGSAVCMCGDSGATKQGEQWTVGEDELG